MAVPIDSLKILAPELRECVYSHLLFDEGNGTVRIRKRPNTGAGLASESAKYVPAVLALPETLEYIAHRRRAKLKWSDDAEDAFLKALCWTNKQHPLDREEVRGWTRDQIIVDLLYELSGQEKCRKAVSSHYLVLKGFTNRRGTGSAKYVDAEQASAVRKSRFTVLFENSVILTHTSSFLSATTSRPRGSLSLHCSNTLARDFLPLTLVNHFYRTECLHHLASNMKFDFGLDSQALQNFCSTAPAELFANLRHLQVTLVEGYMPDLPALPNLRTLAIDLWPRDPTRPDRKDRAWGQQTERLLATLGVVSAVRASIRLEMRWAADCERFERGYVREERWRRIVEDAQDGTSGQEGLLCRRRYELCGNGKTVERVTGEEKEVELADDAFISSFGSLILLPKRDRGIEFSSAAVRSLTDTLEFSIFG